MQEKFESMENRMIEIESGLSELRIMKTEAVDRVQNLDAKIQAMESKRVIQAEHLETRILEKTESAMAAQTEELKAVILEKTESAVAQTKELEAVIAGLVTLLEKEKSH